jgi:ACS family glucarate transporter-like MFS transporter
VIGYFVAATGNFNEALWFVAAHGLIGIFAYVVLAGRFERVVIEEADEVTQGAPFATRT